MSLRIEIQEQPERQRYFSEVEVGRVARRKLVATPATGNMLADLDAHMAEIRLVLIEMVPGLAPSGESVVASDVTGDHMARPALASLPAASARADDGIGIETTPEYWRDVRMVVENELPPETPVDLDTLRAEAEALGVRVDGRWGEARLRQEIAAATHEPAPTSD